MHPKTPKWLQDVLDACDLIVRACEGHTRESFTQNELSCVWIDLADATKRLADYFKLTLNCSRYLNSVGLSDSETFSSTVTTT